MYRALFTGLLLAFSALSPAWAADTPYQEAEKKYSWYSLNRVERDTPAEQLSYCDDLAARNRIGKAIKQYQALALKWPASPEASLALLKRARLIHEYGDLLDAFDALQQLMEKHNGAFHYDEILERQFDIANRVMEHRKWHLFHNPAQAAPLFEKLVRNGPRWTKAPEAQYMAGLAYERSEQYELAVAAYLLAQQRYPADPCAEKAAFGRSTCWMEISKESRNDEEALEQAWASTAIYLQSWPQGEHAGLVNERKAQLMKQRERRAYDKALYYDRIAHKPEAALITYNLFLTRFPQSDLAPTVAARVKELKPSEETKQP